MKKMVTYLFVKLILYFYKTRGAGGTGKGRGGGLPELAGTRRNAFGLH